MLIEPRAVSSTFEHKRSHLAAALKNLPAHDTKTPGIAVVVAIGLIWSVAVSQWIPLAGAEMRSDAVIQRSHKFLQVNHHGHIESQG
jgi:hypothetical protein